MTTPLCACGCKKPARPNSVYFSNACQKRVGNRRSQARRNPTGRCLYPPCGQACEGNYCSRSHAQLHRRVKEERSPRRDKCTCGDYARCMSCRNRERERAYRENDITAYMKPVYAQISLSALAGD